MFYAMSCNVMSCCLMLCMYEDMCGCINTSLSIDMCIHVHIHVYIYIYDTYVCIYVCIYIYTQFNVCFCSSVSCSLPLPPSKCRHAYTHQKPLIWADFPNRLRHTAGRLGPGLAACLASNSHTRFRATSKLTFSTCFCYVDASGL